MKDRYIRRPRRVLIMVGWLLFALAAAALVVLFALAGAGRLAVPVDGSTWVTPTTYGPPCHEDQPCGVRR